MTDDANDLFGYPPRRPKTCPGCGLTAEPFLDGFCWNCTHNGQRELVLRPSCIDPAATTFVGHDLPRTFTAHARSR